MAAKKSTRTKMTTSKQRSGVSRASAAHKGVATRRRNDLTNQLRDDLKSSREALRAARAAAREELRLAKAAAKAEITVLKDQLKAAQKREQALLKLATEKTREMVKAGAQWEKKQIARIKAMKPK